MGRVLSRDGERAVVLLNRGEAPTRMTVNFADAGLSGTVSVRDLRARADRGTAEGSYSATVPAHGTAFLKLRGETLVPGTDLGGDTSASPALVRWDDSTAAVFAGPGRIDLFVRGTDNAAYQRTFTNNRWGGWQSLGGRLTDSVSVAFTGPDQWTLFGRGGDGRVWTRDRTSGWTSIGSPDNLPIYGRPAAATVSAGTFVSVRHQDDSVWYRQKTANGWASCPRSAAACCRSATGHTGVTDYRRALDCRTGIVTACCRGWCPVSRKTLSGRSTP